MQKNLEKLKGLFFSQTVMLKLTQNGLQREKAYKMVQSQAMKAWKTKDSFFDLLNKDKAVKKYLSTTDLEKLFNLKSHLRYTDSIFSRVLKNS
jgi:adenylosuccinate lyase